MHECRESLNHRYLEEGCKNLKILPVGRLKKIFQLCLDEDTARLECRNVGS